MKPQRYLKTRAVWTACAVVTLPLCGLQAQDREPASDANAAGKQPEKSDSQKPLNGAAKPAEKTEKAALKRVTGIGGVFFKAKDPAKLRAWYQTHLGIDVQKFGGATFRWGTPRPIRPMPKPPGTSGPAPISNRARPRS